MFNRFLRGLNLGGMEFHVFLPMMTAFWGEEGTTVEEEASTAFLEEEASTVEEEASTAFLEEEASTASEEATRLVTRAKYCISDFRRQGS
jgi:hypothetical protein